MSEIKGFLDRGATKYFHGRKTILAEFQKLLADSGKSKGRTTFLVQGPHGIGKTALLAKCWDEAEEQGWKVAEIDPKDLWDPDKLRKTLGVSPEVRVTGGEDEAGAGNFLVAQGTVEIVINYLSRTPTPLYTLPIPSLYDYLTERASRIREATLRYEKVKKQRQSSRHLTGESSEPEQAAKDPSEAKQLPEAKPGKKCVAMER